MERVVHDYKNYVIVFIALTVSGTVIEIIAIVFAVVLCSAIKKQRLDTATAGMKPEGLPHKHVHKHPPPQRIDHAKYKRQAPKRGIPDPYRKVSKPMSHSMTSSQLSKGKR